MPRENATDRRLAACFLVLYSCAALQFVRFYTVSATFYLNQQTYLAGHERLPFQYRVLPALLIRGMYATHLLTASAAHQKGAFTPERAPLFLLSLAAIAVISSCTQAIYNTLSRTRALQFAVFPILLFTLLWTYCIHVEANFSYPYDLLSVAFFAAGLLCVVRRQYLPLLLVLAVGTLNRETTLFLIGIFVLDAASEVTPESAPKKPSGLTLRQVPWLRAALLFVVWLAIKLFLSHLYAGNDRSEDYVRLRENLGRLTPRLWPALLNICGYMLPVVVLLHRHLHPRRFRNYLWIFPLWFAAMFYAGVIVETRIYGELCPYVAVALALILEDRLQSIPRATPPAQPASPSLDPVTLG